MTHSHENGEPDERPLATEKREPIVSLTALMFFGGALIWAANQDWLEMAQFFKTITQGWRDFLRALWSSIIETLGMNIELRAHQKDILSLDAILLGGAIYRALFGKNRRR